MTSMRFRVEIRDVPKLAKADLHRSLIRERLCCWGGQSSPLLASLEAEVKRREGVTEKPRGFVYFIGSDEAVKIGYSANPRWRLNTLQVGCPHQLKLLLAIPGTPTDERALQKKFSEARQRGEWFDLTPDIKKFLEEDARQ